MIRKFRGPMRKLELSDRRDCQLARKMGRLIACKPPRSKYRPHQNLQECARRVSSNG